MTKALEQQIREAQVLFVTAASRLLDDADEVRKERDRLMALVVQADKADSKGGDRAK